MRQKKEEITDIERLLLKSMTFDTVCPNCGRAVHVTTKDLYWTCDMTFVHNDGSEETHKGGWRCECKCHHPIKIKITIGKDE